MTRPPPLPPPSGVKRSWLDQQMIRTGWPMLLALTALGFGLMWIFAVIGLILTRDPAARRKSKILFLVCCAYAVFVTIVAIVLIKSEGR